MLYRLSINTITLLSSSTNFNNFCASCLIILLNQNFLPLNSSEKANCINNVDFPQPGIPVINVILPDNIVSNAFEKYDILETFFDIISEICGSAPAKKSTTGLLTPECFSSLHI